LKLFNTLLFLFRFKLEKNGKLLHPYNQNPSTLGSDRLENYCIDGAQDYGKNTPFVNDEKQTILFLCSGGLTEG